LAIIALVAATATPAVATVNPTAGTGSGPTGGSFGAPPSGAAAAAPAATGTIASITGNTLEVQNTETQSQTTVNLTAKTRITATLSAKLSAIKAGSCITASGSKAKAGGVDATTVVIQPAVKGKCATFGGGRGGFGGGGFPGGGGGSRTPPTTSKGSTPTTRPGFKRPTNVATVLGQVTSVSGSTITVHGFSFAFGGTRPTGRTSSTTRPAKRSAPKETTVKVTVTGKTKYSKTETVKVRSLKVGECATAFGKTNSIGAVAATRLTVTQPTATGCVTFTGFGGGGGFGRGSGFAGAGGRTGNTPGGAEA
jgi:hypothetical protein